jgi:hypothetical protein
VRKQRRLLEQAEQFEDDHDNDNYSDYVEDTSVHAAIDIRVTARWLVFIETDRPSKKGTRFCGAGFSLK